MDNSRVPIMQTMVVAREPIAQTMDNARLIAQTTTMANDKQPSRWLTIEFAGHYLMIAQAAYFGFARVLAISASDHPAYARYSPFLTAGWIPGRMMDLSDPQYGSFRRNLPALTLLMAAYLVASWLVRRCRGDASLRCLVGLVFVFVLHGFNVVKILAIAGVNYFIAQANCGPRAKPLLVWAWTLAVLFGTEWVDLPLVPRALFVGVYHRWHVVFKLTVLRMTSYAMDRHWFARAGHAEDRVQHRRSCALCSDTTQCDRFQSQFGCSDVADYDWPHYLAYLFYPPLYLAGPIVTFNAFAGQIGAVRRDTRQIALYGLRLVGCFLLLDVLLHYCHVVAIKNAKAFVGFAAVDYGVLGFFNLKVVWLKLLVIWRYFRLVALVDGVVPPENMLRCMSNNYSGMAFWRSWHRSFYLWIVRYLYVPLGGSKRVVLNMWPVFMFVAAWHDLRLHLLAWSWLVCLFFVPELLAGVVSRRLGMRQWPRYRALAGVAATGSICMMITANLVGFCIGLDGMRLLLGSIASGRGALFVINALLTMYSASQIMFEVRAEEGRKGISNNY